MNILVFGAGAIGGYLGARLLQQGHGVTLIVRPKTADEMRIHGLTVREGSQTAVVHPDIVSNLPQAFMHDRTYDAIILGMKAYDLDAVRDPLVAFCPPHATIITTQNGIDVEQPFIDQFGPERVIVGSLTVPISRQGSSKLVVERSDRGIALAPAQPGRNIADWAALFQTAGVKTTRVADYKSLKWSKALLNIVGNAASAILNRPPTTVYQSPTMFNLERRMLREAVAVATANQIKIVNLPGTPAGRLATAVRMLPNAFLKPLLAREVAEGRGEKMPSFYLDLAAGRGKSEVIYHNGAIADHGRELGIPTPVNATYNDVLLRLTRGELDWREFDGRPKRLLSEVARHEENL